ncbi:MAG: outer membrane beta-barrel protein, partial [Halomonas sp.]|nr:outer membrane beta-barrel protein [Halomonas sp.]
LDDLGFDTDDNDVGYKLFAGYQFNPFFAVEASYLDFGDFTADFREAFGTNTVTADGKVSAEGFGFSALGKLPIQGPFSLYGKLGLIAWDGEATGSARVNGTLVAHETESTDDIDPFYGVGAEYIVNQLVMRAEYERYDLSDSGEDFEIDMISGSLGYHF